jgi:hypothetical protein
LKSLKKKIAFDVKTFMALPIEERTGFYVAGLLVAPGGTVVVPCLVAYELWIQLNKLWLRMAGKRKRGKHKPTHPAK